MLPAQAQRPPAIAAERRLQSSCFQLRSSASFCVTSSHFLFSVTSRPCVQDDLLCNFLSPNGNRRTLCAATSVYGVLTVS